MNTKKGDAIETPTTIAEDEGQAGHTNVLLYAFLKRMKIREHPSATLLPGKDMRNLIARTQA
jgi:hypothetical protein